jgi:hypothetical protein
MKHVKIAFSALMLLIIAFSCQKSVETSAIEQKKSNFSIPDIANTTWPVGQKLCSSPYQISLMVREQLPDGTWLWVWGIKNPNPGDGSNGTVRDLGHWNIQLPDCIKLSNIKAAKMAYQGQLYTYFTPVIESDKTYAACDKDVTNGRQLLKFNLGTIGSQVTLYGLILDKEYPIDQNGVAFYYAECKELGTGITCFPGIGCPEPCVEGCSFSQGYYFAKPNYVWPGNVTIGGHVYTQAEGKAIWESSNRGGISDAKKAFLQVAAIKLSGSSVGKCATVWNEVNTAENWLKTLPKLTPDNIKNYSNKSVGEAAGRIGSWIDANHCGE